MSNSTKRGASGWLLVLGVAALAVTFVTSAAARSDAGAQADSATYIVRMVEAPAVAYTGGIAGLEATKPAKGEKIDPDSTKVQRYVDHLNRRRNYGYHLWGLLTLFLWIRQWKIGATV